MKKYIYLLLTVLCIAQLKRATAQDAHYSQFYTTPMLINPAQTGFFNGNYRFTGIYKNQWQSITAGYASFSGAADMSFLNGRQKDNVFGLGIFANSDKAGDANYTTTNFGTSFAFNKKLSNRGYTQYLGVGGQFAYTNVHFDYSSLHFDSEFTGTGNNEKIVSSTSFMDFSTGLEYNFIADGGAYFNLGAAMYHINQPDYSFINGSNTSVLARKIVLNGGAGFKLNNIFELHPRVLYEQQGAQKEMDLGTFLRIKLDKSKAVRYAFYLGSWYRWNDAVIFVTRFDIDNLSLAFSYDVNTSSLSKVSYGMGGPEISFLYTGKILGLGKKTIACPRF